MAVTTQFDSIIDNLREERVELLKAITNVEAAIRHLGGDVESYWQPIARKPKAEELVLESPTPKPIVSVDHSAITSRYKTASMANRRAVVPFPPAMPDHGSRPDGALATWVSMKASEASPYALCLAILRAHPHDEITSAQLNSALGDVRGIKGGAGYTTLEPLSKAGIIVGEKGKWVIGDRTQGGIIEGQWLWSDQKFLNNYDWAVVRREAVLLLLKEHPNTSAAAMTKSLLKCDWLKSPVDPHLVKADLRSMEKDRIVVQDYETRTWSLKRPEAA